MRCGNTILPSPPPPAHPATHSLTHSAAVSQSRYLLDDLIDCLSNLNPGCIVRVRNGVESAVLLSPLPSPRPSCVQSTHLLISLRFHILSDLSKEPVMLQELDRTWPCRREHAGDAAGHLTSLFLPLPSMPFKGWRRWQSRLRFTVHIVHPPGISSFVRAAGPTISL